MDSSELRPAEVIIGPARLLVLVVIETDSRTLAAEMGCGSVHATNPTHRENPSGAGGRAPGNVGSREAPGRVRPFHRRAHLGCLDGVSLPVPLLRWRFRPPADLPVDRKGGGYQQRSVGRSIVSGERLLHPDARFVMGTVFQQRLRGLDGRSSYRCRRVAEPGRASSRVRYSARLGRVPMGQLHPEPPDPARRGPDVLGGHAQRLQRVEHRLELVEHARRHIPGSGTGFLIRERGRYLECRRHRRLYAEDLRLRGDDREPVHRTRHDASCEGQFGPLHDLVQQYWHGERPAGLDQHHASVRIRVRFRQCKLDWRPEDSGNNGLDVLERGGRIALLPRDRIHQWRRRGRRVSGRRGVPGLHRLPRTPATRFHGESEHHRYRGGPAGPGRARCICLARGRRCARGDCRRFCDLARRADRRDLPGPLERRPRRASLEDDQECDGALETLVGAEEMLSEAMLQGGFVRFSRWVTRRLRPRGDRQPASLASILQDRRRARLSKQAGLRKLAVRLKQRPELAEMDENYQSMVTTALEEVSEGRFTVCGFANIYLATAHLDPSSPKNDAWWGTVLQLTRDVLHLWKWDAESQAWVSERYEAFQSPRSGAEARALGASNAPHPRETVLPSRVRTLDTLPLSKDG